MEAKSILLKIVSLPKFRATLRWLHHSQPVLWKEVLSLTPFLSDNASAPQRVWHIINDVYEIPKCPISGEMLKWADFNRGYCATISRSAKTKMQHNRGDFDDNYTEEINRKRSIGNKRAVELGRKYRDYSTYTEESFAKARATCLERYGVDNYRKSVEMRTLMSRLTYERQIKNGGTPRELRDERRIYYEEVGYYTNKNWVEHFDKINPTRIERGPENHLDHIYSRKEGFRNGIDPKIIGHWTNLQLLPRIENSIKRDRCDKTIDQLLEDYARHTESDVVIEAR